MRPTEQPPEPWRSFFAEVDALLTEDVDLHCCGGRRDGQAAIAGRTAWADCGPFEWKSESRRRMAEEEPNGRSAGRDRSPGHRPHRSDLGRSGRPGQRLQGPFWPFAYSRQARGNASANRRTGKYRFEPARQTDARRQSVAGKRSLPSHCQQSLAAIQSGEPERKDVAPHRIRA